MTEANGSAREKSKALSQFHHAHSTRGQPEYANASDASGLGRANWGISNN